MTLGTTRLAHEDNAEPQADGPFVVLVVLRPTAAQPESKPTSAANGPHLDIELAIRLLDDAALAESTRRTYAGALRRYREWLAGRSPTDRLLAAYLGVLFDRGLAPPSAELAVAAVRRAVRDFARAGHDCAEPPAVHLTAERLERFRRDGAGWGRGQAGALRWEDADSMSECAEAEDDPRGIRDAALIGVTSDALLRVSETSALDAADVSFRDDGSAHLTIPRSKTDQHGDGAVLHVAPAAAGRIRNWMDTAGIESGPLFRPVAGRRMVVEKRLGSAAVRAAIKRRAVLAGIFRRVSGHSLRVGAAQSLAEGGASLVELQVAGRWTSTAMPARYVRGQDACRGAVARLRGGKK